MEAIPYSQNWNNKLDCTIHTTIRLNNPTKYKTGNKLKETLKGKDYNIVEVIEVRSAILEKIPDYVLIIDTGLSAFETKQLITTMHKNYMIKGNPIDFKTQLFDVVYLKIIKKL